MTHREACQKEGFYLRPIFFSFCTIRCRFLLWLFLEKNVVGAASDNFIYDLEKTSFSFEYYCSKSSHSIEGRFQVAWIIDLQKWLFPLIMHEHILFTFNRKNTDSRPYHWRKGLCIYTKTVVTYVLTGPSLRFWKFRREIIFLLIKFWNVTKYLFLPNMFLKKFRRHCAGANEGPELFYLL